MIKKKNQRQRIFIISLMSLSIILLAFLFATFFLDIIKYQLAGDTLGMKHYLEETGIIAPILIVIMEAIQMICVFISVEFIQTATAITYPWYIALPICVLGVLLGAILIYLLVRLFKFDSSIFEKNYKKAKIINDDNKQKIMYLLFITPIVPFGFICYYGATQKMSFKKYLFTAVTGALPDILLATVLGNVIKYALINDMPIWVIVLLVLAILGGLALLCNIIYKKSKKYSGKGTPDSRVYTTLLSVYRVITKNKPNYDINETFDFDGPFIILSNHPSCYDVYYICETIDPIRPAFIMNRYYFKNKLYRKILKRMGTIPKKILSPDIETIKRSMKTLKNGYPIYMCPEGRMSVDGTNYEINIETAKFIKQNKVPVVIINISGAYLARPKWRKTQIKGHVETTIYQKLSKEDVMNKSLEEITDIINNGLKFNDFEYAKENNIIYKGKNKALGLENVLYYCPSCKKEHVLKTKGNTIYCTNCDLELEIDDNYWFKENKFNINNIHEWYKLIENYETNNINNGIDLNCEVTIKKYNIEDKTKNEVGSGICYLNNETFGYKGDLSVREFSFKTKELGGLAFSAGEEFECYYNNELYYFYPKENKSLCAKWSLIIDIFNKLGDK